MNAPNAPSTLAVSEVFSPTIQGEGPAAGRAASFIRLMGCNLSCSWCDSPFTWDATRFDLRAETTLRTAAELAAAVHHGPRVVVLTGGEPLLQQYQPGWSILLGLLTERHEVHIETNGTVLPSAETLAAASTIVVSPKLDNAGGHRGHQDPTLHPGYADLGGRYDKIHLKVVCESSADVLDAVQMGDRYGFPRHRVWVMPEGTTREALHERWSSIATAAASLGISASHRLHVLAWGDERGR